MSDNRIYKKETMVFGYLSDRDVAQKVRMLFRDDLDHEAVLTGARDRIMYLSQEVASLNTEIEKLRANAMPGGPGCCDICDTGGCCKTETDDDHTTREDERNAE